MRTPKNCFLICILTSIWPHCFLQILLISTIFISKFMSKWWLVQLWTYHRFFSSLRTMWQKSVLYYLFWEGARITLVIILLRQESIKRILPISSSKTSAFFAQTLSLYCLCTGFKSKEGELWSMKKRIIGTRKPREPELRASTVNIPFLPSCHGSDGSKRSVHWWWL